MISSSWHVAGRNNVAATLARNDIDPSPLHEDWATVKDSPLDGEHGLSRTEEIQAWLAHHPETDRWVSLDDEDVRLLNAVTCGFENGSRPRT